MSLQELTDSIRELQELRRKDRADDVMWGRKVEEAITDHAGRIEGSTGVHNAIHRRLGLVEDSMRGLAPEAARATVEEMKAKIEQNDSALKLTLEENDTSLKLSIAQTRAALEAVASATAASLDTALREHVQETAQGIFVRLTKLEGDTLAERAMSSADGLSLRLRDLEVMTADAVKALRGDGVADTQKMVAAMASLQGRLAASEAALASAAAAAAAAATGPTTAPAHAPAPAPAPAQAAAPTAEPMVFSPVAPAAGLLPSPSAPAVAQPAPEPVQRLEERFNATAASELEVRAAALLEEERRLQAERAHLGREKQLWQQQQQQQQQQPQQHGLLGPVAFGRATQGPSVVGTSAHNAGIPFPAHVQNTLGASTATAPVGQPGAAAGAMGSADPWAGGGDPWGGYGGPGLPGGLLNMGQTSRTQWANIGTPPQGGQPQRPPQAAAAPVAHFPGREYDHKRPVFDDKVAMDASHRYNEKTQEEWLKTTKNYLVSKAYEMELLLDWAEGFQLHPISPADVAACDSAPCMTNIAATRLDRELWSWLNLNLTGSAKETFDNLPRLQGFEAWRKIVVPMAPRTLSRMMSLYTEVRIPPRARSLRDVASSFETWEAKLRVYARCGGADMPEYEKVLIALKVLPVSTPASMMLAFRSISSYTALKSEIESQVLFLKETQGLGSSSNVHLSAFDVTDDDLLKEKAEEETRPTAGEDVAEDDTLEVLACLSEEQMAEYDGMSLGQQIEVLAVTRARFGFGKRTASARPQAKTKARPQPKRPATPPRTGATASTDKSEPKCGNCGGKHYTRDCRKALIPVEKRPCFKCGQTGHQARQCPNPALTVAVGPGGDKQKPVLLGCVTSDDDWSGFCVVFVRMIPPQ